MSHTSARKDKPAALPGKNKSGARREQDADAATEARWRATQERLRRQAALIRQAECVRSKVEVMLMCELEEGTYEDEEVMKAPELDRRKQRIKDWLAHLVRLQLAEEKTELAKAKFDLTRQKSDGNGVLVNPEIVLDHRALMNLLEKRPELMDPFEEERNAIDRG